MRKSVIAAAIVLAATVVPLADAGALSLQGKIPFVSVPTNCPADVSDAVICHVRRGTGIVAGLGSVSETYVFMADPGQCVNVAYKVLGYTALLSVAGKGELDLAVAGLPDCIPELAVPRASPQSFTVTGGRGAYDGASGNGTLTRVSGLPGARVLGEDTWTGTLVVPALEFDITVPTFSGASSKTVLVPRKAKRVRVTYTVTATDDRDGSVSVSCRPASGSRFKVGRTPVTCSATDGSGNTAKARFIVSVKRRR